MKRTSALALLLLGGCNDMVQQPRYDDYEQGRLFANGMTMQAPPPGTVDRAAAPAARPPLTLALVRRGQDRFGIYCAPCHGLAGDGDGVIVSRGFPRPPSYHSSRLRAAPDRHFVDVIGNGYGAMFPYASRIAPADRWAITAYVRALQRTRMPASSGGDAG